MASLIRRRLDANAEQGRQLVVDAHAIIAHNVSAGIRLGDAERMAIAGHAESLPFGPVSLATPAAIDRLALMTSTAFLIQDRTYFRNAVETFADAGTGGTPAAALIGAAVQARLAPTLDSLRWRDAAVAAVLRRDFLAAEPLIALSGGALAPSWAPAANWVREWTTKFRSLDPRSAPPGDDGLFDGTRPLCLHPLALALLEPRLTALFAGSGQAEASAFCDFLNNRLVVITAGHSLPAEAPEITIGAGALLARHRASAGVAAIADRLFAAIAAGFEVRDDLPPGWRAKDALHAILAACPDWAGPQGLVLRERAHRLGQESMAKLAAIQESAPDLIPNELLATDVDLQAATPSAPRPSAIEPLVKLAPMLRERAKALAAAGDEIEVRASGLQGEWLIARLAGEAAQAPSTSAVPGRYWPRRIAALSAPAVLKAVSDSAWKQMVGERVGEEDLPPALDIWDGLRGLLVRRAGAAEGALVHALGNQLPHWLVDESIASPGAVDTGALRPVIAAVGVLGMPLQPGVDLPRGATAPALIARIDALLAAGTVLTPGLEALLAALRIDLTIALVAGATNPAPVVAALRSRENLVQFAAQAEIALAATTAWERRAGVNGFSFLCRLAELSGDPFAAGIIANSMPAQLNRLVAQSVARLLSPPTRAAQPSALPLGIAASSLMRAFREQIRGFSLVSAVPAWLGENVLPPGAASNLSATIRQLSQSVASDPTLLSRFAWGGGPAGRALLLALFQIASEDFALHRQMTVEPLRTETAATLRNLRNACRSAMCIERVLAADQPDAASELPWWSLRFWSGSLPPAAGSNRALELINWIDTESGNVDAAQLTMAATLAGEIPVARGDEPTDIDLKSPFALPVDSFQAAHAKLDAARNKLHDEEDAYVAAVTTQLSLSVGGDIAHLLRQPLLLDTADAQEQVAAADAEARRAEADLTAADHEIAAANYDTAVASLIYEAARIELEAQATRKEIERLRAEIAAKQAEAADAAHEEGVVGVELAQLRVKQANALRRIAELHRQEARQARQSIRKNMELLVRLLRTPVQIDPGRPEIADGLIARAGARMRRAVEQKLNEDNAEAVASLAAAEAAAAREARRRDLAKQRGFFKSLFSVVGAVVGVVVGGPAGASLGASIAGAATDLISGIATEQPLDEIFIDLAQNVLTAAKAAGVNLDSMLANLGTAAGQEATQLFDKLGASLGPVLANAPEIVDAQTLREAFRDIQNVAPVAPLVEGIVDDLRATGTVPDELGQALAAAGVADPIGLAAGDDLPDKLESLIVERLEQAGLAPEVLDSLGRLTGVSPTSLGPMAERLSKLVATRLYEQGNAARNATLKRWIAEQQRQRRNWVEVEAEGRRLVATLFPDRSAQPEIVANLRAALSDPNLLQAQLKTLMIPWQDELDRKIAEANDAGEAVLRALPDNAGAVAVAKARVKYIEETRNKMIGGGGLFPFLAGNSTARAQLLVDLDAKMREDEPAELKVEIAQLQVNVSQLSEAEAQALVNEANIRVSELKALADASHINVEAASWQNKLNEITGQKLETIAGADAKAEAAAEERAKAAAARRDAAAAALEARVALARAARQRASEASRIRHALSRPPLRLDGDEIASGQIALASKRHLNALEDGFTAARELLRLVRALSASGIHTALREPDLFGGAPMRWSDFLEEEAERLDRIFIAAPTDQESTGLFDLTEDQIAAMLPEDKIAEILPGASPRRARGLMLIFRPGVRDNLASDRIIRNIKEDYARNGAMAVLLLTGTAKDGTPLTDQFRIKARYLGDHWVGPREVHFIGEQEVTQARSDFVSREKASDPARTFRDMLKTAALSGGIGFSQTRGTPISGTTILRLEPQNAVPIGSLSLSILKTAEIARR